MITYAERQKKADEVGHEIANDYPVIPDKEFAELVESVRVNGVRVPIVMLDGKILDGRNRWAAGQEAGVDVPNRFFDPPTDGDPQEFVTDLNYHRRHLEVVQKGFIWSSMARRKHGQHGPYSGEVHACTSPLAATTTERAEGARIGLRTLKQTDFAVTHGTDALKEAMREGTISVKSAEQIARFEPEKQEEIIAAARARTGGDEEKLAKALQTEAANAVKRDKHAGISRGNRLADPDGVTYDVGVADPPWKYEGEGVRGEAAGHYPTMTIREICAWSPVKGVPVRDLFAKNAVLFLWTTVHNVWRRGLAYGDTDELAGNTVDVADAWGFPDFRGCFVWVKPHYGMGQWARNQYEHLAIFTRGTFPTPPTTAVVSNVLQGDAWPLGKHSEKPPATYDLIERMTPGDYRRVEFFARSSAPGWKGFGNQVPSQK